MIEELRKAFAEWLAGKALLIYPKSEEKDSFARCMLAHSCFVSNLLEKNNNQLRLGGLPVCLYNKLELCPMPYLCELCDDKPPVT